jgi:adenosylcobinamide kinase/adenosylcobinamide-phosphate guanylyltransferase
MTLMSALPFGQDFNWRDLKTPLLLIGPAYAGKSDMACEVLPTEPQTLVIGTAPRDEADTGFSKRLDQLQSRRPGHWDLLESPDNLADELGQLAADYDQILLDSLNQWTATRLLALVSRYDLAQAEGAILQEADSLNTQLRQLQAAGKNVIIISNEAGAGVSIPYPVASAYRRISSRVNYRCSQMCPSVIWVVAGVPVLIKKAGDSQAAV